jgi:membrane-associated phospholipid phosphatase
VTGQDLVNRAHVAANRIESGIELLTTPDCLEAFRIANKCMAEAGRRRLGVMQGKPPEEVKPSWRPFQLAFLLMNLRSIAEPGCDDRDVVDLLFFPTGGGKTEAYLGLAAFTLVLRRLRNPGITSAALSVLMRYTLRLLTFEQLSRAAMVDSLVVDEVMKAVTMRERPTLDNAKEKFFQTSVGLDSSFPSTYSMIAWSSAAVIASEYNGPMTKLTAYGLATGLSATRVLARQHFPSDVLVGSAVGWLVGRYVFHKHHKDY